MTKLRARGLASLAVTLIMVSATMPLHANEPMSESPPVDWLEHSIAELQSAMQSDRLSSAELVAYYLDRINQYDQTGPALNAIAHLNPQARVQARALDDERAQQGPRSMLHGIPIVVKDNYETIEMPTGAGSKLFSGFHPERDATLVARLRAAGAVILAKTTMHEFAYGITTVGSSFGLTKNPYNLARNPGGSSGGTGAAVAANFAVVGMGSDTCGSIRIPAAQNNLVGLRATQGMYSRHGIVPLSSTQDIGGPLARSVADLAITLDVLQGEDLQDPQTKDQALATDFASQLAPQENARLGVLTDWLRQEPRDVEVAELIEGVVINLSENAAWEFQHLRSPVVDASVDRVWNGHAVLIYDFKRDIERYLAANPGLGFSSLRDMMARKLHHQDVDDSLAASVFIADEHALYDAELAQRRVVRDALTQLLDDYALDALVYPTIRHVAALHGEPQMGTNCRLAANSGLPAISVPVGFTDDTGMPVGIELLGRAHDEQRLLNLAQRLESQLQVRRPPPL